MKTQINEFPALKECELKQVNRWLYLIDKRDGKVIYCPINQKSKKKIYEELCFLMEYGLVVESYVPINTNLEFKKFDGVRYKY